MRKAERKRLNAKSSIYLVLLVIAKLKKASVFKFGRWLIKSFSLSAFRFQLTSKLRAA
jgi:hypothetical protein